MAKLLNSERVDAANILLVSMESVDRKSVAYKLGLADVADLLDLTELADSLRNETAKE